MTTTTRRRKKRPAPPPPPPPKRGPELVDLIYVGRGRYIIGVPATDLTVPVRTARRLVASGLYRRADARPIQR